MQRPLAWLATYDRGNLRPDVVAGLTVGALVVPQSMAYATLAGMPPITGLYAALVPVVAYAALGTSRHLAVGPTAVISLLVASGLAAAGAVQGSATWVGLALLLALMAGVLQIVLGFARMGAMCNYVSHAVTSGFTSAAAIIIGLNQLKMLLGIKLASSKGPWVILRGVWHRLGEVNVPTAVLGGAAILVLVILKKMAPRFPTSLTVLAVGTAVTWAFDLGRLGVATVGKVPVGLPAFTFADVNLASLRLLAPAAVAIALVGFIESIAVAHSIAIRERYRLEPDQELAALGLANVAASLTSGFPVTGSLSRTAVNHGAGGRTHASSLVTAIFVLLSLLFLTPLFRFLPMAALAAIIFVAALRLIDLRLPIRLFDLRGSDGWTLMATFVVTLAVGVIEGIFAGVGLSLLVFIWRTAHPHVAEVGYRAEYEDFRDVANYPEAETFPDILILRVDARLYFANAGFVHDEIVARLNDEPDVKKVILDLSGVNDIDAASVASLEHLFEQCAHRGSPVVMAHMKGAVRDMAKRAGWIDSPGEPQTFPTVAEALASMGIDVEEISPGESPSGGEGSGGSLSR